MKTYRNYIMIGLLTVGAICFTSCDSTIDDRLYKDVQPEKPTTVNDTIPLDPSSTGDDGQVDEEREGSNKEAPKTVSAHTLNTSEDSGQAAVKKEAK